MLTQTNVKVEPTKSILQSIDNFEALSRYIEVLAAILDYIDHFVGHPFFTDYGPDGIFKIAKITHGVDGYCLRLLKNGVEIATVGYYHLDPDDTSWIKINSSGEFQIYGFPQENKSTYSFYDELDNLTAEVQYSIDNFNETMYDQLEFMYSKTQVNGAMCMAKLSQSDKNREYRQFVFHERPSTNFGTILGELKDYVYHRTMLQGGFK